MRVVDRVAWKAASKVAVLAVVLVDGQAVCLVYAKAAC